MKWLGVLLLVLGLLTGVLFALREEPVTADLQFASALELNTLDPQKMSWMHDLRIAECVFEPLLKVHQPDLALEGGVACSWEVSPDGLQYTFHLRPEAKWSNGDPVVASDFIYAWRRAILPDAAAEYTNLFYPIVGAEEFFDWRTKQLEEYVAMKLKGQAAEEKTLALWQEAQERFQRTVGLAAPDARTLVVRLKRRTAYFPELCAFGTLMPVHAKSVEKFVHLNADTGRRIQDPGWTRPEVLICNGPYVVRSWRFKRDMLLEANPHFWNRAALKNHSIKQVVIENPLLALLAYENHELDWLPDLPTTDPIAADLVKKARPDVFTAPAAGTYYYVLNSADKLPSGQPNPLRDARVRRAFSMAVDRQALVDSVTRLHQPPARTLVPVGAIPGYDAPADAGTNYDPEGARKLLGEAGYPDGKGISGLSILYNGEGGHEQLAQAIRRNWETVLNVTVALESCETRVYRERRKNKDFSIARAGWYGDYRDPTTFLDMFDSRNTGNNDSNWASTEYDTLLDKAADELDPRKRLSILRQAEVLLLREHPVMPIYQYVNFNLFDPQKLHGLTLNAWNFRRLEFISVDRK